MKMKFFLFLIISFFFLIPSLRGLSITDFDKIVNFSITLEELTKALETNDFSQIDDKKFVIINGTASVIRPDKSFFFLLTPEDIVKSSSFINKLKKASDKVSLYLVNQLPADLQKEINTFNSSSDNETTLLKNITNELKKLFRKNLIYDEERFEGIALSKDVKSYVQRDLATEEMAFVNRLLMEAAYPAEIKEISIEIEIVYGVWIGYDEVKSYKSIIEFKGPECFKIFVRKKPEYASREMVNINSTVLIVARILKSYVQDDGIKGWFLEGHYIRGIR